MPAIPPGKSNRPPATVTRLAVGGVARLTHPVVSEVGTLPVGLSGQIRSLHRRHARLACQIGGRALVLKVPLEALSA